MVTSLTDEVRTNIFTSNNQTAVHMAALAGGGYVSVWQSINQNGSGTGLVAQIFNEFGEREGLPFFIEEYTPGDQTIGGVAATADGGFVVAWRGGSATEIVARQFDASGSPTTAEFQVNTNSYSTQHEVEVAGLTGGGYVITWSSYNATTNTYDIRVQRYDAAGTAQGGEVTVNTTTSGTQSAPEIASLNDGGYVIVWVDQSGNDGSSYGIFGQRFNASGVPQGAEFVVNSTTSGNQYEPSVTALDGGGFVVVWRDDNSASDGSLSAVVAQIYDASGATVGGEFVVNEITNSWQYDPSVTATPDGGFFVSWNSYATVNGTTYDIVGRHFDSGGNALTGDIIVSQDGNSFTPEQPDVIALDNGAIVVGWDYPAANGDGDGRAVYQRLLQLDGSNISVPPKPILEAFDTSVAFTETELQSGPQILDASGAVAVSGPADFDGGRLIVSRITAEADDIQFNQAAGLDDDILGLRDQGTGAGQVGVSGTSVTFGGVVIGTITSDGTNRQPLEITFNANADRAAVEAVAENLTYENPSDDPAEQVQLAILLESGDGATSEPVTVTVSVTPEQDAPRPVFDNDIEVNTFGNSTQQQPVVASLPDGGWIVMWESYSQDSFGGNTWGIVGQRYDSSGATVGAEFLVNTQVQGSQQQVDVTAIEGGPNAGGFIAVWYDPNSASEGYIRAQIFDAASQPVGGEIAVPQTVYSTQQHPSVVAFADGSFAVAWSSYELATNTYDIIVQRFDASGSPVGAEIVANTFTASTQDFPDIIALAGGGFAVSWESYDQGGTNSYEIATRIFDAAGTPVTAEARVNTVTEGNQRYPDTAALSGGGYVVVWEDQNPTDTSVWGVYGQLFDAAGAPVGTQFLVNEETNSYQYQPVVTALPGGGFAVAYSTAASAYGGSYEIAIQHYDASGNRIDGEIIVNQDAAASQYEPAIATLANGDTVVVFRDDSGRDGSGAGIVMQIVGDAANYAGAENNPIISIARPTVVFDESNVNAGPQLLFDGVDVGDADSADFDGGLLSIFRAGAAQGDSNFNAPDDASQDNLGIRNQGTGTGQIGVSGTTVTFGGAAIGTVTSDGADGAALTVSLNANATPEAVEALLQNVTYANPSDDPEAAREMRVVLTDGDGGSSVPINVTIEITPEVDGFEALSPERQVNSYEISSQDEPDVAALASGGYVTTWRSYDQDAGAFDYGIYAQRFDASGQAVGPEIQINSVEAGSQIDPQIAGLTAADGGGYVVVWYDQNNNSGYIKAQVHNDDGSVRTAEFMVESLVYSTTYEPAVTTVPGGFLVTWSVFNNSNFTYDIRGQFFDGSGAAQGSEFTVNTAVPAGAQDRPDVAADAAGNVVVVWEDRSTRDGSDYGIFAQRIDSTGALVGTEFQVNTETSGRQYQPSVDFLSDGRFVVTWADNSGQDGSGYGVSAQIFAADGTPIGGEFQVNEMVSFTQDFPTVVGLSDGGFAISFADSSGQDGSGIGSFVQLFNADGSRRDGAVQINEEFSSSQYAPRIAEISDGIDSGLAAVWVSSNSAPAGDGNGDGIFTRVLGTPGTLQPTNVSPKVENLDLTVDFEVGTIATAQIIDNSIELSDLDSSNFDGGMVELLYIDYRASADDQLSVINGKGITLNGSNVEYDGTVIGTIDGTANGVNGADLIINLNANATAANVRYLMEQLGYASTNPVNGVDRSVSIRVTDGDGGRSDGDSIHIELSNSVSAVNIRLTDLDNATVTESEVEAGVRLDPAVDFDYNAGNGFAGGSVAIDYRTSAAFRETSPFETLSVANDGSGPNQISVSGTNVSFEGTIIGSIDGTLDGQGGANLRINLLAAATQDAVDALIESVVYQNVSDGPPAIVRMEVTVRDANGLSTGAPDIDLTITPEADGAPVPLGGEMQVNGFTAGEQIETAISELSDGGFVVTWQSNLQDGNSYGVYQQRYNAEGEPVGPEVRVNQSTFSSEDSPDVTGLPGGGWVTVWDAPDASGSGIYARIFDSNGNGGNEFLVNVQDSSTQQTPKVEALSNGNFVVSWESVTSAGAGDGNGSGVIARVFDSTGTPVTASDFVVNTFTSSTQQDVSLAALSTGGFVAVWESNGGDGAGYGISFRRFDNSGTAIDVSETQVNTTTAGSQVEPSVAALTGGGFVVAWEGPDGSGDGIYQQRFDASGNPVGGEELVNDLQSNTSYAPEVIAAADGGWFVTFSDNNSLDGSGNAVLAQRYDSAGNRVDGNFVINEEGSSSQYYSSGALLSDGRVAFVWDSETSGSAGDGSNSGIFLRLFGEPADAQSDDPVVNGIADVTLSEADLNAGFTQVFADGAISVADLDSTDFAGGRLMVHVIETYAAAEQFLAPDDPSQDVMTFAGTGISLAGGNVSVGGVVIGTLEADGQSGNGLEVLFNANATPELVETLLGALNYRNPSNDPRDTREIEVTLSDGDGGVSEHQTFTITITPETDGFEKVGDEQQVNSFTSGQQYNSDVAGLAGGGHVVVWASYNQDNPGGNDYGIFAQRFDVDGQPVGPEFQVNTTFASSQNTPKVVGLSDGTFVVAWEGNGVGDSSGVFGQRFAANGTPTGTEFRINDTTSSSDTDVELAAVPSGGFMAVWDSSTGADVAGRIYDASGTALGSEFVINDTASGTQSDPDVAALTGGGFAVTWYDATVDDVYVRLLDASGGFLGASTVVNTNNTAGNQNEPQIAALAGGGFVVTWVDTTGLDGSNSGVYAQVFSAAGAPQGDTFLVNETTGWFENQPEVVGTPDGGFVIVFRDQNGQDGSGQGVFAQQFDANGNRVDGQFQVNTEFSSTQNDPAIDVLSNGGVVISWTSTTSGSAGDGSGDGVFSQIFGNPADFNLEGRPVLQGVNSEVTFLENALNIGPLLLDANNAVSLSDSDSTDFDGGFIRVDNVIVSRGYQDQIAPPDNFTQDNLGLRQAQGITITASNVFVDGTQVGSIISSGTAGTSFEISLNANATIAIVELLVENLTYRNTSDDPEASRVVRVQVGDGDGGVSDPSLVTVNITPEIDGAAPVFGERQANTETNNQQDQSDVATLADGGFVIVWRSYDQDAVNTYGVYGQRFDANGNAVGTEFQVNTTVAGWQYEPSVTGLDTGGWVVTWRDDNATDGSSSGVFMQRYNADGTPAGGETQVNTFTSSVQYEPDVTMLANGDYVVTWTSFNSTDGSGYGVYAQVYAADGTAIGSEFRVNSETSGTQDQPSVTALETGGFAIAWTSQTSGTAGDGNGDGVFYQVFADDAANYAPVGGELQANSYVDSTQDMPKIVGLTGGGHVIVWSSNGQDGSNQGVFAQQYDAAGLAVGQEFRVNDQRISTQYQPDVAALSNGGYVIVFSDFSGSDGSGYGVYAQQYDANGNRIDDALQVNTETSSTQDEPSVSALADGGFVVSWTSTNSGTAGDGSSDGVFYQVFSNSAPVVTDVSATTAEDTNLVFDSQLFADGYADAEGQALTAIRIDVLPSAGTLEFNGSPVSGGQIVTVAELDAGALVYIPPADFNGSADFGWTGSDGSSFAQVIAQTNITVTPVNDPVGLQAIADQTISEGSNLGVQALLTDPDVDTYLITVNYGEGDPDVVFTSTSKTPVLNNVYGTEGTYTVSLTVDDQMGSVESQTFDVTVENAPPIADNESLSTDEDTPNSAVNVFIGDNDPGGDPFSVTEIDGFAYTPGTAFVLASGATVTISATGDLTYDPTTSASLQSLASGQNGSDSFTYTITDDGGLSDTATVSVSVSGADDNVDARDDLFTVDEDSSLTGSVFADNGNGADVDPEGDALTITAVNGSAGLVGGPFVVSGGGILQINADGTISFNAAGQYNELNVGDTRDIQFSYVVQEDGSNLTASANGTITITGVNDDPNAVDDARTVAFNTPLNIDVTANDNDVDIGDSFDVTSVSTPGNGTAVIETDGTVTYTPNAGFTGTDSFDYTITDDNGGTSTATVTVNVQGSATPTARPDAFTTDEETAIIGGDLFADNGSGADSDPEGDPFTITAVNGLAVNVGTQITLGSGALLTVNSDGTFDYDPTGEFDDLPVGGAQNDSFTYTITDTNGGSSTTTATVTVNGVNDAPTMADGAMNAAEDGAAVNLNLATLGDDVDSDDSPATLTYAVTSAPADGTAIVNGTQLNFDPGAGFQGLAEGETGTVTVGVTATDQHGATSNEGTVTVSVLGVNDAPTLGGALLSAVEDGPAVTLDLTTLGDDIDSDDDGASLSYAIVTDPAEGSASINPATGVLSFDPGADFQDLGAGDVRQVTVQVQATDAHGAVSSVEDVVISVTGVNDAPTGSDDGYNTNFETPLVVGAAGSVLLNDGDVDGDSLTAVVEDLPANGALVLNSDGTFTYTPDAGFSGTDSFTYRPNDGTVDGNVTTVTIDVAPQVDPQTASIAGRLFRDANGNDADDNEAGYGGQTVTLLLNGTVVATATTAADGSYGFTALAAGDYVVQVPTSIGGIGLVPQDAATDDVDSDVDPNTGQVQITLLPAQQAVDVDAGYDDVNDAPTAVDDTLTVLEDQTGSAAAPGVLGNDTDPNADPLVVTSVNGDPLLLGTAISFAGGASVTVNADGSYSLDAGTGYQSLAAGETAQAGTFTYQISDGDGGTDTATVVVNVTGVNDDPTADDATVPTDEDTPVALGVAALIADVDGDALTVEFQVPPTTGTVVFDGTDWVFTPAPNLNGIVELPYTVDDGNGGTDSGTITVNIAPVNDAPAFDQVSYAFSMAENQTDAGSVSATDVDGDTLTYAIAGGADAGLFSIDAATGALTFDAPPDFETPGDADGLNTYDLQVSVSDGGTPVLADVTVTVTDVDETPGNTAPIPEDDILVTDEDTVATGNLLTNDDDNEGDTLEVVAVRDSGGNNIQVGVVTALATGGTILVGANGDVVFDPAGDYEALGFNPQPEPPAQSLDFIYTVSDGEFTEEAAFTVDIRGVNDAPVFDDTGPYSIVENTTAVGTVSVTDVDSTEFDFEITGGADMGLFSIDEDTGALSFNTAPDFETPGSAAGTNSYEVEVSVSDETETITTTITVDVTNDPTDDTPTLNPIVGTAARDVLFGTAGDDEFFFNGGFGDIGVGAGGDDVFNFEVNMANGVQDSTRIADWSDGDSIVGFDLNDVNLNTVLELGTAVRFTYGPDNDVLLVTGDVSNGLADLFDLNVV